MKQSDIRSIKEGIQYVGQHHDLFLKHYMDKTWSFDDEDLCTALCERGVYH